MAKEIRDGRIYLLRVFTRTNEQAWEDFKEVWRGHTEELPKYGITVHGVWVPKDTDEPYQIWALLSYPNEESIDEYNKAFVASPVIADVVSKYPNIRNEAKGLVDTKLLPMEYSPLGA
jgi:hypothetical protein